MCGKMLCTCCSKQNCYIFIWSKVVKQNIKFMHFAACNIDRKKVAQLQRKTHIQCMMYARYKV